MGRLKMSEVTSVRHPTISVLLKPRVRHTGVVSSKPSGGSSTTVEVPVEVQIEVPRAIIYNFRGWDPSLSQFEFWQGTVIDEPNPSGNPLVDITLVSTFT